MLRTVIYMRRSSEEKEEKQIQSIERQERELTDFIEKHNNSAVSQSEKLYVDWSKNVYRESHTAKKPGRPIFKSMIDRIEKGHFDVLLCVEQSRLSRNPIDTGVLINIMDHEYIKQIRTLTATFSSESVTDRFTLNLFLSISKYENDQRGKNASSGMQNRKAQGATTNIAPMGYRNAGIQKGAKFIEKDGENFDILRDKWDKFLTGKYKISELYREAQRDGLTLIGSYKEGKLVRREPAQSTFRSMFSDIYYKGCIKQKNGIIDIGLHDAMVTNEEFDKAQIILQKSGFKHSPVSPSTTYENLLENILVCGITGNRFYADIKKRYYCPCGTRFGSNSGPKVCPKCSKIYQEKEYKRVEITKYFSVRGGAKHKITENGKTKERSNIPIDFIEKLVQDELDKINISDGLFDVMRRRLYTLWLEEEDNVQKKIQEKRKEIDKIRKKKISLVENAFSNDMSSKNTQQAIEDTVDNLEEQVKTIEEDISDLRDQNSEAFEIAWQSINTLLNAKNIFSSTGKTSFEPRRHLLLSVFSNLIFRDGIITPDWKKPFGMLADQGESKKISLGKNQKRLQSVKWLPG